VCGRRVATAIFTQKNPVGDAMEGVGNTAGDVQGTAGDATNTVGADKVGDGAGSVVTGTGDAVGGAADSVGATPKHVGVLGGAKINPVSTALKCVINLTVQYMGIYTAIAMIRVWADFTAGNVDEWVIHEALTQATLTVNYAPMLAIMFLACRMRVLWLTLQKGNPPIWVQGWMYGCTYAVLAMTLVALVVPLLTGKHVKMNERGDIDEDHKPFENKMAAICFTVLKYLIMIGLYIGAICIIYGTYTYKPPKGSWPGDKIPPVSPAVECTMILASMYFLVYAGIQFAKTFQSFSKIDSTKLKGALEGAICTMFFAPMIAVLCIGARMRALQMDPINGAPQKWAQSCFYMCTYAIMFQCIFAIATPLVMGGKVKKASTNGDCVYDVENKGIGACLQVCRWIIMISIYLGVAAITWSIYSIEHPKGKQYTPPISVTMQCVVNLTWQFFTVYTLIWIGITVKECFGWNFHILTNAMENARGTIAFCPMLAILFVGTRMRALQLTMNKGAPQGWAQDGMYMATWSVLLQFMMVLLIPIFTYIMEGDVHHPELDKDGNVDPTKFNKGGKCGLIVVQVIRWIGFILLYVGTICVMVGAYTMTPETANGRGSVPLVGETPFADEPAGPNDLYGVPGF